jgi:O-antigen/teichoic acid export membrane protein
LLSATDSYVGLILQLVSTMIIARVLTPKEVGIFAVAAVFSGLASTFRDFGVAEYMIQERHLENRKIAAALALNILTSWSMAAALYVGAPFAAHFYDSAGVGKVMRVQALSFLLVPFGAVTMAYFRRELNYTPILICNVAGTVTAFVVAVTLALLGFGYMSLAWSSVAGIATTVAGSLWFRPPHFPVWPSLKGLGTIFQYSKFASLVYIVGQVGKGAPEMIIGRVLTMADVAMFSRANGLVEMFHRLVFRSALQVCMPYFAKSDRDQGSVVEAYLKSVSYITAVGWPVLLFTAAAAFSAIRIVYGPQWDAAIPLARILCAACAIELLSALAREALMACGKAREANALQIRQQVLILVGLLAVVPFGLRGAAIGVLAASAGGVLIALAFLKRSTGLRPLQVLHALYPSAMLSVAAVAPLAAYLFTHQIGDNNYLAVGIVGGLATMLAWLVCLFAIEHPLCGEIVGAFRRLRGKERFGT